MEDAAADGEQPSLQRRLSRSGSRASMRLSGAARASLSKLGLLRNSQRIKQQQDKWTPAARAAVEANLRAWAERDDADDAEREARHAVLPRILGALQDLHDPAAQKRRSLRWSLGVARSGGEERARMQASDRDAREVARVKFAFEREHLTEYQGLDELEAKLVEANLTSAETCAGVTDDTLRQLFPNASDYARGKLRTALQGVGDVLPTLDLTGQTLLTSLPELGVPLGNVLLRGCTALAALPADLDVLGYLGLEDCSALREMPPSVRLNGPVDCIGCSKLESFGASVVAGALSLEGCEKLADLPDDLRVDGDLCLDGCQALTVLPAELHVTGDVNMAEDYLRGFGAPGVLTLPVAMHVTGDIFTSRCHGLASLPAGFRALQRLDLSFSDALVSLPEGLRVGIDLDLGYCTRLEALPDDLSVGKSIRLEGCTALRRLPDTLTHVLGDLDLEKCTALVGLPDDLTVEGDLELIGCTALQALPEVIYVGRDLDLEGATLVREIPPCILAWVATPHGPHNVYLNGCGVPEAERTRLRSGNLATVKFHTDLRFAPIQQQQQGFGSVSSNHFETLDEAVTFWGMLAQGDQPDPEDPIAAFMTDLDLEPLIQPAYRRGVLMFLTKLRGAREFRDKETQAGLGRRVMEVLRVLKEDEEAREEILIRMGDSVNACSDKPVWALNQMTLIAKVSAARGDRDKLRKLGRGVMNLEIVHKHVQAKIRSMRMVDDVCIYLRFEIDLREKLDLPVSATAFLFPRYMTVHDHELKAAEDEARAISEDAFEAWLVAWPEWQRQLRLECARDLKWEQLPRNSRRFSLSWTNVVGDADVPDPVRLDRSIWSMDDLLQVWVRTGMDLNNTVRSVEEMRKITRCRTLPRASAAKRQSQRSSLGRLAEEEASKDRAAAEAAAADDDARADDDNA